MLHALNRSSDVAPATVGSWRVLLSLFDPGEPHPFRGPFARWPHTADGLLALLVFCGSVIFVTASALPDEENFTAGSIGDLPVGAFVLLAVASVALVWRRTQPLAVTVVVAAAFAVWAVARYGDGQDLAIIVAIYSVGRYVAHHHVSLIAAAGVIGLGIVDTVVDTNQRNDIAPAVVLTALAWYIGRRIRIRRDYLALLRERAERLEADQQARAHQAVVDERARIARELHDVVAHQVSMMTVQAGAAKTVARSDLDAAVDAMGDVERSGRQALGELRHLLGVLRPESADHDGLGPQPGLDDISTLVEELTSTGAEVSVSVTDPADLSAAVELAVYRIVQESVTNIIKHAGPNPSVRLSIGADGNILNIDVSNTIAGSRGSTSPVLPHSGYGIAGMRERVALLGGSLRAELQTPDRFSVSATIPIGDVAS